MRLRDGLTCGGTLPGYRSFIDLEIAPGGCRFGGFGFAVNRFGLPLLCRWKVCIERGCFGELGFAMKRCWSAASADGRFTPSGACFGGFGFAAKRCRAATSLTMENLHRGGPFRRGLIQRWNIGGRSSAGARFALERESGGNLFAEGFSRVRDGFSKYRDAGPALVPEGEWVRFSNPRGKGVQTGFFFWRDIAGLSSPR